ncbi:FAD/NAD(P)-binding domain-containing protein [Panus rudis PR-1116 ss-1]|nr:FAD/NAD(P)-binding domain-containing protein [Panus rudis PR-1116 ss-1]
MSTIANTKYELPTLTRLKATIPSSLDVHEVARKWIDKFSSAVTSQDIPGMLSLCHPEIWWRDLFALTWDLRTFQNISAVKQFLEDRLKVSQFGHLKLRGATFEQLFPDLAWISVQLDFETKVAAGKAIVRLVPPSSEEETLDGEKWKAYLISTNLEDLLAHPEKIGSLRNHEPNHGKWLDQRAREVEFADGDPEVLIVGAGQSGLNVAARLKHLGVSHLIIEKTPRIGDQWRNRYTALCLHNPVWNNHLAYIPFPESWPVYIPAQKLANFLEFYADTLELNVWTSSEVLKADRDESVGGPGNNKGKWVVTVRKADGSQRVFRVDHIIFTTGAGFPNIPDIPNREEFQGQVLHSTQHKNAKDHIGKKVVIVGACTSAHDIAADYVDNGVDVTIYQRSSTYVMSIKEGMPKLMYPLYWQDGPPTEIADRIDNSFPFYFVKMLAKRICASIHEADRPLIEALHTTGYRTNYGEDDTGFVFLGLKRGGGFYFDAGACQKIIDGKIKVKNGSQIEKFTKTGLRLEDGTELDADIVLYATGFTDVSEPVRALVPSHIAEKIPTIWGINDEGENRAIWRELGTPGLWFMTGNFAWSRFFSKHLALQIKAKQQGLFGERYSAPLNHENH